MSYSAGLSADYWRGACVSWGSAAYVEKGADWVGAKRVTRDGVTARAAAGWARSQVCVCCAGRSHMAGQGRLASVNSSSSRQTARNKLGSRDCGKRASLQRALRFAFLGTAHRDRPLSFLYAWRKHRLGRQHLYTRAAAGTISCDRHWLVRL